MARTDWAEAWVELGEVIASKSGHGRAELLEHMARIAAAHRVPEELAEKALRVYGPALARRINEQPAEESATGGEGSALPDKPDDHRPPVTEGGHDGRISTSRNRDSQVPA